MKEAQLQTLIVQWLDAALPAKSVIHHSPNEGRRHVAFQKKLRGLGTRWGWPDLELFVPPDGFWEQDMWRPLFLEVKTGRGRLTDNQRQMFRELRVCSCHVAEVRSISNVEGFLAPMVRLATTGRASLIRQLADAQQ